MLLLRDYDFEGCVVICPSRCCCGSLVEFSRTAIPKAADTHMANQLLQEDAAMNAEENVLIVEADTSKVAKNGLSVIHLNP